MENSNNNTAKEISYLAIMFLKKKVEKVDYSILLSNPVIKYSFSPEYKSIIHDVDYLRAMNAALCLLKEIEKKNKKYRKIPF